jgi:hypothetical protein
MDKTTTMQMKCAVAQITNSVSLWVEPITKNLVLLAKKTFRMFAHHVQRKYKLWPNMRFNPDGLTGTPRNLMF